MEDLRQFSFGSLNVNKKLIPTGEYDEYEREEGREKERTKGRKEERND
jgi:hypothetical protein